MYFIDIGANDGKKLSNTFLLENNTTGKGYVPNHYQVLSNN